MISCFDWVNLKILRFRNFADTYVPTELIKSLTIDQGISAQGNVLEKVHATNLLGRRNGRSEIRVLPVDRSRQAFFGREKA